MTTHVTPAVKAVARRLGVNLAEVRGSGVGGRIRPSDLYAKAGIAPPVDAARPYAASGAPLPSATMTAMSKFIPTQRVQIDPYAANPLVDDYRQINPVTLAMAQVEAPAPTLFSTGDLPLLTASGIDPQMLLKLPWEARHPAARADQARVAAMFEEYATDGTTEDREAKATEASMTFGNDPSNLEYRERLSRWLAGRGPS